MKEESKQEIKKNIITGVSTAAGGILGSMIENAFHSTAANAKEVPNPNLKMSYLDLRDLMAVELDVRGNHLRNDMDQPQSTGSEAAGVSYDKENAENKDCSTLNSIEGDTIIVNPIEEDTIMVNPIEGDMINVDPLIEDMLVVNPWEGDTIDVIPVEGDYLFMDPTVDGANVDDMDMKVSGNSCSDTASLDMPDYVNDANIDSFINID